MFGFIFGDPESGMSMNTMAPGLFVYACIFIIMTVAQGFSEMRDQELLRRLNTTPMTSADFIASEIFSNMVIVILQLIIIYILAIPFGFTPNTNAVGMILAFVLIIVFSLSSVGLGLIIATISKSSGTAMGLSFLFIFPQMFLGTFIPVTAATEPISMFMPSYYVTKALSAIFNGNLTDPWVLTGFPLISIVSLITITIGVFIFKKLSNK
jgi:ABC-2 type transport system permease protein